MNILLFFIYLGLSVTAASGIAILVAAILWVFVEDRNSTESIKKTSRFLKVLDVVFFTSAFVLMGSFVFLLITL